MRYNETSQVPCSFFSQDVELSSSFGALGQMSRGIQGAIPFVLGTGAGEIFFGVQRPPPWSQAIFLPVVGIGGG